jgi:hypothetical protein
MFTIVKVRPGLTSYEDPGWYDNPPATIARPASADELRRDGISAEDGEKEMKGMKGMEDMTGRNGSKDPHAGHGAPAAISKYTCPMHPEVVSDKPGKCPKCGMALVPKT